MVESRPWLDVIRFCAGVHQQEAAGAVSVFGLAGGEAGLAYERGVLVAEDAADGEAFESW